MRTRDPIRFWGMTLGAAVFGFALAVAAVQAQPAKPQSAAAKPPAARPPAGKALTDGERKIAEELQSEQKQLDTDIARAMAASPDGRRRVAATIAKNFNVSDKVVNDLRARKMGYGEVTITLALSQQLMKREKGLTQQQAIDRVVGPRKSGLGWGVVARDLGLKLGDAISDVKKTDKQLAKLDTLKTAKADKVNKPEKAEKAAR